MGVGDQGWPLVNFFCLQDGCLFEVGANSRLGAYSNKYGSCLVSLYTDVFFSFRSFRVGQNVGLGEG